MANPFRGEVTLTLNGSSHTMKLTLGALAALETRLEAGSLMELAERYEDGRIRASDLIALLSAGLMGGGHQISEEDLSSANIEGGTLGAMKAGLALLAAAFQPAGPASNAD